MYSYADPVQPLTTEGEEPLVLVDDLQIRKGALQCCEYITHHVDATGSSTRYTAAAVFVSGTNSKADRYR